MEGNAAMRIRPVPVAFASMEGVLQVALGAIARKPVIVGERVEPREFLGLTLMFDHDAIDGAPMAMFLQRLRERIESGYGLEMVPGRAPAEPTEWPVRSALREHLRRSWSQVLGSSK